ncbi:SWIM zinc finger family protein [Nocardia puris]|uniref:Putative Zn finger protein n=1 Tax=Nocardia puris TaxID=208602 RepID=A0A366D6D6_9NOCA|nr:SWIM zinc finger family protein [Nocardia puris]MBF6212291.1 SWIM zinc finger family protein [Nocardia puris]MBF6366538.1 SWIM zinc finger family protein [Nocardia puris]MBF6460880.1 SWIM zinc finger family protein [Nocardia puris]RBO85525.1 putative Zn finger protein [Nocardia puris]
MNDFDDFGKYGKRRPVRGGVAAKSRRGGFGRTWWGKALIDAVEAMAEPGRLARGRTYARSGQVVNYRIEPGAVVAEVQGSQPRPFTSVFAVRPLRAEEVELLIDAIRGAPGMLAAIASGELPPELGPHLLPTTAAELDFSCSCPDPGWPCKHVAAVCYLVAERLDERPREILTLRGLDLDTLIAGIERESPDAVAADLYGDELVPPDLPKVEYRSAVDDLDPVLLRKALRTSAEEESVAATGARELDALYERLRR